MNSLDYNDTGSSRFTQYETITIRGDGYVIVYGINNHFSTEMPGILLSRLAPEEFEETIMGINKILNQRVLKNFKKWVLGCAFFCCTMGFSFGPSLLHSRKTKRIIRQYLTKENKRFYNSLGFNWTYEKECCGNFAEYVLQIQRIPKQDIINVD